MIKSSGRENKVRKIGSYKLFLKNLCLSPYINIAKNNMEHQKSKGFLAFFDTPYLFEKY